MKWLSAILSPVLVGSMMVGGVGYAAPPAAKGEPIKIGAVISLTGVNAAVGKREQLAVEVAAEEINGAGGIKSMGGSPLDIHFYDNQSNPAKSVSATEQALSEGMKVIIFGGSTAMMMGASTAANRAKVVFMDTMAMTQDPFLRNYPYLFMGTMQNLFVSRDLGWMIDDVTKNYGVDASNIIMLSDDSTFSADLLRRAEAVLKKSGYNVTDFVTYAQKDNDLTSTVLKLKAMKPSMVVTAGYPRGGTLLSKAMFEQNFRVYLTGYGLALTEPSIARLVGLPVMNFLKGREIALDFYPPGTKNKVLNDLMEKMRKKVSAPGDEYGKGSVEGYFGVRTVVAALAAARSTDPDKFRDVMLKMRIPPEECSYMTEPGGVHWDPQGRIYGIRTVGVQWRTSATEAWKEAVWPEDLCKGKIVFEK
jgi:branched-chain amino acid transport system substrate-binding protein